MHRTSRALPLFLLPTLLLLAGCGKTIVGKWTGQQNMMGTSISSTLDFKKDGTLQQTATAPQGNLEVTGTYKTDGDKVHINVSDIQMGGKSIMGMIPPQAKAQLDQEATYKIEGDTMTLTRNGQAQTLNRVKE